MGGGDISSIIQKTIMTAMAGELAGSIIGGLIDPLIAEAGQAYVDSDGDLNSVLSVLSRFDLSGAESEIIDFQNALSVASNTVDDFSKAFDSIQNTIDGIMGGSGMGVQSKEYFESRYASLLSDAQSDPTKVSDFTGFANDYLDFISDYGDPGAMEQVLNDLFSLQAGLPDPASMADEITGGRTLFDLYELLVVSPLVTGAYAEIGRTDFGTTDSTIDQAGYDYWVDQLNSGAVSVDNFMSAFTSGIDEYSFADGGIISGPSSGYTIPTTFHGVERITPESDFQDMKGLLQQLVNKSGGEGDVQIKVFVGNKELKSITAEIVRTDPETQTQIRRVARV
jgi:hypothetical protein